MKLHSRKSFNSTFLNQKPNLDEVCVKVARRQGETNDLNSFVSGAFPIRLASLLVGKEMKIL